MHQSPTAKVILAFDEDESALVKQVALKFFWDSEAFHREVQQLRRGESSSAQHSAKALNFHPEMQLVQGTEFTSCIAFEQGERTLADAMVHDAFAGKADDSTALATTRDVLLQLSAGLLHLHETCRAVHCDFKAVNAMQFGRVWKLIDFDSCVLVGQPAGLKYSTLVAPPELITTRAGLPIVRDPSSEDRLLADPSYDVWSFGVMLFHLLVGRPIFLADLNDNLDAAQLELLLKWNAENGTSILDCMAWGTLRANLGKDLLHWILQPNPSDRPSVAQILMHPFFADDPTRNLISCSDLPWNCRHTDAGHKACPIVCISASEDDKEAIEFFSGLQSRCPVLKQCLHMQLCPTGTEDAVQTSGRLAELQPVVEPRPRVAALCVAVDQFDSSGLSNLSSCCVGARLFAGELESMPAPFSAAVTLCENPDRTALRNAEATFCQQLQDASASLELVVVFVASHGCQLDAELFFAVRDTQVPTGADGSNPHMPHFRENFVSVNKLISRIRVLWKGPLALIADTCRSPAYPGLNVETGELSEQISYTESILCCFSTAARAAANDGMDGMPNPFTAALLRCLFNPGAPLRSTILDACTMLGKEEQPSCAILKFSDVPLIPAFCEILHVGSVCPDSSQLLLKLRKAVDRHQNAPDALIVVVASGNNSDVFQRIEDAGVSSWKFEASTGSSNGKKVFSKISSETYARIICAWEARSGLSALTLLSVRALQCSFRSLN